jgi:hypothetical protein
MSDKGKKYTPKEKKFMAIMKQHKGIKNIISGPELYRQMGLPPDKRGQRIVWDIMMHMIFIHNKAIVTVQRIKGVEGGGYFIAKTKAERESFENTFITGALTRIARVGKIIRKDTLHAAVQVALSQFKADPDKKVEGLGEVVAHLLSIIKDNPHHYSADIDLIKQVAGEIFVDADTLTEITELSQRLTEQLKTVGQGQLHKGEQPAG